MLINYNLTLLWAKCIDAKGFHSQKKKKMVKDLIGKI